ncbi:MAG: reverse transcriptase domain-containing protein, partial [Wenzhouxiangella sp.]
MKTHNSLYPQIYQWDALLAAWYRVRKGRREQADVLAFEQNLESELIAIQNDLIWGRFKTGRYHLFQIHEPKPRMVAALPLRDRVVHHALVAVLEPIWEPVFYAHSYACRPRKGTHRCADQAERMLRRVQRDHGQTYALKADIASYFASIDHDVMRQLIRRRVRCRQTLALCDEIIDSAGPGRGLPIGNLTSQLFAGIYLDALDRHVKHDLRWRHYIRYQDDFVLLGSDKAQLHVLREHLTDWLRDELRLELNRKTAVYPVGGPRGRSLDFVGYRIWPTHRKVRTSSIKRMNRTMRRLQGLYAAGRIGLPRIQTHIQSWIAHAR